MRVAQSLEAQAGDGSTYLSPVSAQSVGRQQWNGVPGWSKGLPSHQEAEKEEGGGPHIPATEGPPLGPTPRASHLPAALFRDQPLTGIP